MSPEDRREQRRNQTHQQLIGAAKQVFSEKGFDEASILDITEAANVSKRTFYLHFTDREALIEEIALQSFEEVRQQIDTETMKYAHEPMRDNFYRVVLAIFEFAQANNQLMQILLGRNGSIRLNAMVREYMVQAMNFDDPRCRFCGNVPLPMVANAKAGVIFQLLSWWVQNDYPYSPGRMAELAAEMVLDGIGKFYIQEPTDLMEVATEA